MLKREQLHSYQNDTVDHIKANESAMLWLQMGLGKTVSTLTAFADLQKEGKAKKMLVLGPLRVIQSAWTKECRKWEHLNHLSCVVIHGKSRKERLTKLLSSNADIYLINYESCTWFVEVMFQYYIDRGEEIPFDVCVYDEVSWMKNSQTARMSGNTKEVEDKYGNIKVVKTKGWRKLISHFKRRIGLTGSPASNGYLDLFGQFLAVDNGERLGQYITHYKQRYFTEGFNGWSYSLNEDRKAEIEERIADITIKMDAKDYLDLPSVSYIDMFIELPAKARKAYTEVQEQLFTALDDGSEIELFSKQSISAKCLQFANGAPYLGPAVDPETLQPARNREHTLLHKAKLEALEEVLESANGQPVLCSYTFKSDAKEIMKKFKKLKPVNLTDTPSSKTQDVIDKWNEGKIKLLIGYPKSMGHGIDGLQDFGSIIVWYGLPWSLELYEQMNARINRQGQTKPVSIIRILCSDTVDIAVLDAIINKEESQEGLKASLQRYRDGKSQLRPRF